MISIFDISNLFTIFHPHTMRYHQPMFLHEPEWLWAGLHLLLVMLFCADALLRRARLGSHSAAAAGILRPALWATALWIAAALVFAVVIHHAMGKLAATEYLAGYGIEEALSIDNLFVFLLLFRSLQLDAQQQHRIFFWGLAGAVLLRACAIAAGVSLFQKFIWVQLLMGGFLIAAAVHMFFPRKQPQKSGWIGRWTQWAGLRIPSAQEGRNPHPWKSKQFIFALLLVQVVDLIFAVDSIPAVLAVTHNFFIVYASNIFAVAGMRALYFVIAGLLERLSLLHYGLAAILLLAGAKLLLAPIWTISAAASLAALGLILALTVAASLLHMRRSAGSASR